MLKRLVAVTALVLGGLGGCSKPVGAEAVAEAASAPAKLAAKVPVTPARAPASHFGAGDAVRGEKLVAEHQCNRCHEGTGQPVPEREFHCVNCHREILSDTFPVPKAKREQWKPNVRPVRAIPSLTNIGERVGREWIASFLLSPYDLRPMLHPSMPRLGLSPEDARDIATFLTKTARASTSAPAVPAGADLERGRRLIEERGCGSCHEFTGVPVLAATPSAERADQLDAVLLAPDFRHTRDRFTEASLLAWLADPRAIKPDTLMPSPGLDPQQARDVAAYLLRAPLAPAPARAAFQRLPALSRAVSFQEVDERVFRKTCRHCHGDPSMARGDGGPGNTGGFGFKARGIDFSSYRAIASGYLDAKGQRHSLFELTEGGVPRLLAALLARHDEQGGNAHKIRGMPLGLPALNGEQIQLVESWIAQGRPR
jgi:cytochrome c2